MLILRCRLFVFLTPLVQKSLWCLDIVRRALGNCRWGSIISCRDGRRLHWRSLIQLLISMLTLQVLFQPSVLLENPIAEWARQRLPTPTHNAMVGEATGGYCSSILANTQTAPNLLKRVSTVRPTTWPEFFALVGAALPPQPAAPVLYTCRGFVRLDPEPDCPPLMAASKIGR